MQHSYTHRCAPFIVPIEFTRTPQILTHSVISIKSYIRTWRHLIKFHSIRGSKQIILDKYYIDTIFQGNSKFKFYLKYNQFSLNRFLKFHLVLEVVGWSPLNSTRGIFLSGWLRVGGSSIFMSVALTTGFFFFFCITTMCRSKIFKKWRLGYLY